MSKQHGGRPKPGDVFGLNLKDKPGLVCFQVVNLDPKMGALIRVFPSIRAEDMPLGGVTNSEEQFFTYVALNAMLRAGFLVSLGTAPPPATPAMRGRGGVDRGGKALNWQIVMPDGKSHRVDTLSADQEKLSMREIINADELYDRVATAWTPVNAEERRARAAARLTRQPTQAPTSHARHHRER
jgi:hypothetical protein